MKTRLVMIGLGAALMGSLLSGCGSSDNADTAATPPATDGAASSTPAVPGAAPAPGAPGAAKKKSGGPPVPGI